MNRSENHRSSDESSLKEVDKLVRSAIICTMIGMLLVLVFLLVGFQAWSVGLGVFIGMPVMFIGVGLYIIAVFRDLRIRRVLDDESDHSS